MLRRVMMGGGGIDPYFSTVVSLLHFDGADGSTTFTDVKGRTWTAYGDAQIDTSQSVYGGASGLFDGVGDYIGTASHSDFNFGTGDFTLQARVRPLSLSNNYGSIIANGTSSFVTVNRALLVYGSAAPITAQRSKFGLVGPLLGTDNALLLSTTLASVNTWYHVAVTRSGNTFRLFINGIIEATATYTGAMDFSNLGTLIGKNGWDGAAGHLNANVEEFRANKGICRWTSDFTPEASALPDS